MKRKLNEVDAPEAPSEKASQPRPEVSFRSLGLDERLVKAAAHQKFHTPTAVQAKAIPLILRGEHLLARARTGSGKTAAYCLPVLHAALTQRQHAAGPAVRALVLVPTRELAGQVAKAVEALSAFCAGTVRVENLTRKEDDAVQRARLASLPDVVVATPGRVVWHLESGALSLEKVSQIVVDEADLMLSYGYEDDIQAIANALPKGVQAVLMSATLKEELGKLQKLFSKDPVVLSLDDETKDSGTVAQYVVKCSEDEKFLLCYAIFILKLIKGKIIIFVGNIDRCYRLKLFLEQFSIKSCVLNSELPVNSRIHVVEEFNRNVYDIIIASDEHEVLGDEEDAHDTKQPETKDQSEAGHEQNAEEPEKRSENKETAQEEVRTSLPKRRKRIEKDKDYGVARGIDFKNVSCVLNFDLPSSSRSYTHRIGRTARAGKSGMALSFVISQSSSKKQKHAGKSDEEVLARIAKSQEKMGHKVEPYAFDMKKLDGFRYRLQDALRAVTNGAIREARVRELRQELIKSEKLKRHFEENPDELRHLRHDGELRPAKVKPHMKHVPDYLVPGGIKRTAAEDIGFVPFSNGKKTDRGTKGRGRKPNSKRRGVGRKANPLQSFKSKRK
jgi:ATP-dependent RNA helicase DDX56/DBP9